MTNTSAKRPYGTNAKRRSVTITESDWQKLKTLGNGNASAGIRKAVEAHRDAALIYERMEKGNLSTPQLDDKI